MRISNYLAVAALTMLPAAGFAEAIPQSVVIEYVNTCVSSCDSNGSATQCDQLCGCVGTKMSQQWTREDYERYSQAYQADPNNEEVRGQVDGFIQQCASAM